MTGSASKYFSTRELECACGCGASDIHKSLLEIADAVRESLGAPLSCNSGVRCKEHNASPAVSGKPSSYHVPREDGLGYAMDLSYYRAVDKSPLATVRLYVELEKHSRHIPGVGLGLYHWGCHIDLRSIAPDPRPAARWENDFPWPRLPWPRTLT